MRPTTDAGSFQKVVIVDGTAEMLAMLDHMLEPGHYDVQLAHSTGDAYSVIRRLKPNLVLLGLSLDRADGYHVLSMLRLDPETRGTRVVTCAVRDAPADPASRPSDPPDDDPSVSAIPRMN